MSRSWERPFFALILLISVFALPVSAAPQWSNPVFAPENHSVYVPSATYTFYITWSSEAAVSLIEANFTGTYANYTATKDGTTYYYSIRDLGAGGYGIRFYANNSTDNTIFNVTSPLNYTVAKAQPITKIYINNSESGEVTIENNTGALLAADLLNTTILTSNFGFEVGRTTDPSLPNGWTYGDIFTYSITDSLSWTWNPLYSLDNFTGARSLLYNFSDNNPNHAAYFVRSNFFPINNSMNYTIIAYVKPNMTFNASRGKPSTYGLWIDFTTLDEFNNFDSPDGTAGVLLNNTDIFIDRAEDNPSIIRETKMEDASKEGWKKVTILLNSSNIPSTSVKGQITFGSYDLVYDGTVLVDDIMVLGEGQRLNKTVNISSNLTGFGQDKAGTPLLSNETRVVGTGLYNITSFFLEDQNYSFASEAHNLISGLTTSMTVTSENSSYSQTTGVGIEQFNAKIIVNYTNSSGFVIAGPSTTCRATTNVTDSTYILAYSSGSKTYNLTIPTDMLFGSVLISVTCSGNRTYMPNTTSTTFGVWQNMYFRENDTDVSFANGAYNTTRVFNSSIPSTSNWYISNLSVNTSTTTGSLARFVLLSNGTNGGYGTEYLLKGNASIRGNISVNDSSLEYYPCLQHYDSEFNLVEESCGSQRVKAANNTYGVDEFEVFVNLWEPKSGEYLAVDWRYNWTGEAGIGASFNITYNSSLETPNVVIYSAQPLSLKITEYDPVQQSTDYTVSSLQEADALFSTKISFNNTQSIRIRRSYNYLFPIYDANISFVTVRSSTNAILNNTITHINEGSITHTILGPLRSSSQRHRTSFTSEQFTAAGVKNETVAWTCINCIHAAETLTRETLTVKQWNVSVHSHLTSGKDIHNVTAITDYSAYGAYSGWAFAINVTNSSGMLDVTNQSTIYSNNTIKLPKTKLSTVIFTITATGKSNGVACTASNECATNNCCGSVCSSSCTVTNTVSGSGGGGGISTTSRD
ncbi:MAG TPA: hypothetical protein VJH90_03560, partial [archaeon]|nr:hypothetical protein [archaeon]